VEQKYKKIYVEWWKIQKSTLWGLGIFVLICAIVISFFWYATRNHWFDQHGTTEIPVNAARIMSYEGEVRITRAATRETIVVTKETYIAAGDTIQTQADGRATVQMLDGSVYTVRPNSTVVVRDNSSIFGGVNVRVALDDGQLNVRTETQPENSENVVEMLDSETRLRSETDASFNTESGTGEIRISRGSVETSIGGESSTITENQYAAINENKLTAKEELLRPPTQKLPANQSQVEASNDRAVSLSFTWDDTSPLSAGRYQIQVARSPYFSTDTILIDRPNLQGRTQRLSGLTPGNYYWRLKTTGRSGQISEWSEPWKFTIVKRDSSASITADEWNVEKVGGNIFIISGKTQPGLLVRSQNREVFAGGDGSFRLQVSTPLSEIAVEFVNDRGGRTGYVLSLRNAKVLRRF
jgi:hypothetical protein